MDENMNQEIQNPEMENPEVQDIQNPEIQDTQPQNPEQKPVNTKPYWIAIGVLSALLVIMIGVVIFLLPKRGDAPNPTETRPSQTESMETTVPEESTEPVALEMLPHMAELYAQNPDIAGYIKIEGTAVDYPVMFTPEKEQKYSRKNFEGKYSISGLPFINQDCSINPESDNLIIYGHNMRNGKGFCALTEYADEEFYKEHPVISYSTLYEDRNYEIVAAFYDRVYYKYEKVFKYYQFIDYDTEAEFNEAVEAYRAKALYNTGVELEYGDQLLTLITCSYHHKYGRFVVIAKLATDDASGMEVVTE